MADDPYIPPLRNTTHYRRLAEEAESNAAKSDGPVREAHLRMARQWRKHSADIEAKK
jgi:hypothetical protein